jgi:transcriptional regulator with XRE-family HTH domain
VSSYPAEQARVIPLPPPGAREKEPKVKAPLVQEPLVKEPRVGEPRVREPLWRHIVGDVLRRERLAQERRLKDVAEAARISMPYLSEIERGRKEASSEVLAAAAHALGLGLADLLGLAQDELAAIAQARRARTQTQAAQTQAAQTQAAQTQFVRDGARIAAVPGHDGTGAPAGRHGAQYPRAGLGGPRVEMSLAA